MNELLSNADAERKVVTVNEILDRLRELLPKEARLPKDLDINVASLYAVEVIPNSPLSIILWPRH
jgi:hypothetical protein